MWVIRLSNVATERWGNYIRQGFGAGARRRAVESRGTHGIQWAGAWGVAPAHGRGARLLIRTVTFDRYVTASDCGRVFAGLGLQLWTRESVAL